MVLFLSFQGVSVGSYVTQCNATDADVALNAQITYHIVEGAANKFSIDNLTGIITTTEEFDRETGIKDYMVSDDKAVCFLKQSGCSYRLSK